MTCALAFWLTHMNFVTYVWLSWPHGHTYLAVYIVCLLNRELSFHQCRHIPGAEPRARDVPVGAHRILWESCMSASRATLMSLEKEQLESPRTKEDLSSQSKTRQGWNTTGNSPPEGLFLCGQYNLIKSHRWWMATKQNHYHIFVFNYNLY